MLFQMCKTIMIWKNIMTSRFDSVLLLLFHIVTLTVNSGLCKRNPLVQREGRR